ncbi:AMP-binding protein [Streptomyces longisporoflavus]|uniref:AMP-binding protein n=1 Tax=Streptomyces longisporoflavus TaxID=28044 RepID=UPI00167C8AE3|nr:AMP-binding protein [Streptomyces longisporoflavus]
MTESQVTAPDARPWLRFYAAGVPHRLQVPDVTIPGLLDAAARRHGARTGFRGLHRAAGACAETLRRRGIRYGDRVALVLPGCPWFAVAWHAVLRLGAVAVAIDPAASRAVLRHQLAHSGAVLVVACASAGERLDAVRADTRVRDVVTVPDDGEWPGGSRPRKPARTEPGAGGPRPGDPAVLAYATAEGPAAVLTHANLVAAAHQLALWHPQLRTGRETALAVTPLWQPHGLLFGLTAPLLTGSRTILLPDPEPQALLRTARRRKATLLSAGPADCRRLLRRPAHELEALATVRTWLTETLDAETADRIRGSVDAVLVEGYGIPAAAGAVLANPHGANARPGTSGLPLPGTEVRIGREGAPEVGLPSGHAGELLVRGPQVCAGYWGDPAETARRLLPGGWLRTGDVAVIGPDGYVTVIGGTGAALHGEQ